MSLSNYPKSVVMNKIVTILVAAMFFLVSATYSQTSLTLSPTTITGNQGETVTVSLIANDFTDIVSMQFGIQWDPAVLQYNSVDNFDLTDLSAGNFNADSDAGFLSFSWFDNTTQGISVANGTALYTISFTVLGDANSGSTIIFASRQGLAIEVASTTGEVTNAVTFTDAQFGDPSGNGNSSNTTTLGSSVSSTSGDNGTTVCVDVSVSDFTDITTMNYSLNWDASVLQFSEIRNITLTGLNQGSFDVTGTDNGQLGVNWVDVGGATAANGTIYQICFNLIGAAGTSSAVSFSDSPTPISVTTTTSPTSIGINQSNGTISVNNATPPPPPPNTGTSLINVGTLDAEAGTTVCIPVTVNDFDGIASLQFSLQWDPTVLQFTEVQNLNIPDLNAGSFNTEQATNGQIAMAWFDNTAQGVTIADGTTIFDICFTILGASGTASNITFSDTPTQREAATANNTIPFTGTAGTITVDGGIAPPPPASTGDAFINIGAINTTVGSTICVPVTVNDFDAIASLQFSLAWDPAVLQFNEVTNFNLPDLNAASFNTTQTASGQTAMAWFDNTAQGVTLTDGTTLFELCFTVLGADGTSSNITFTDTPTQREAANANTTITFTETNGSVTVGDGTPPPPPPPSTGGDALVNLPTLSAEAGSTVCLPVTVNDFNGIASLQFSLQWDPTVLEFSEVRNFNLPDLNAGSFNTTATASGTTAVAWFDNTAQGVTLQDDATLFEICFTVIGTTNENSTIVFTDEPTQREAATASNTITFTETNGSVTVGSGTPPPPPPPPTGDGIINISNLSAASGTSICVPVTTMDFDAIAAMQFSLAWDPTVLEFTGTQNFGLSDLTAGSFNTDATTNGQISVAWFDNAAQGITLVDGSTLFELCFNVIGANGTSTNITFTDTPTARELATASGTIDFESSDGMVTVEEEVIMPPTGDGIINIGNVESPAGSSVCIPVSVKDFDAIASMQFSLAWDPSVLQFTGVGEAFGLPDLSAASFNVDGTANGQLAVAWFDQAAQGVTLADGTILFEMCFDVIGADGATTDITFTDVPTTRELATANGTIDFLSSNGLFTVGNDVVMPPDTMQQDLTNLVNIANQVVQSGEAFCVPVVVADFDAIAALQFSMGWNPAVIEFTGVQNFGLPDLTAATFNTDGAANGALALAWFDNSAQGVTLMDGDVLFEVCFNAVGNDGMSTVIAFTDTPTQREAATANVTVPFTQTDGTISIGMVSDCPGPIVAVATPSNVTCNGMNDGSISLDVSGGDGTYTYTWSDPTIGNIPNPTGLAAGVYNVTITSCNGDQVKSDISAASLTITEPPAMTTVITPQNATCFDVADGRINVSISGGTQPYTYEWSDASLAPTNRPVNVPLGNYSVTITDAAGCQEIMDNITIASPPEIVAAVATTPASCSGIMDGSITLTPSGGSGGDYTYQWSDSNLEGANPTNVAAGDYTVTITDGNQCTNEISVTVEATVVFSGMVQVIADDCGDSKGAIQVTPNGGTEPYTFTWAAGPVEIGNTGTVENIPTGSYSVTITDTNGCFYVENIEVGGPTATLSASNVVTDVECNGESNGGISITAAGGFSPYTYAWSNGVTTADNPDLPAGEYMVTITDSKVCTYTETFTVGTRSNLSVTVEITKGAPNATAVATATGGVEPYTYEWCNGQTTPEATDLDEGNCSLTVMDALGCTIVENIDIIVDNPEATIAIVSEISCNGLTDGSLQVSATGGRPDYTYAWNTGETTSSLTNIGAGTYEVTVTDEVGNIGTATFDLMEPSPLVIDLAEPITMDCEMDGKICINISGGTMPYKEIKWSNDVTDLCVEGLRAGDYGVIVTDQNDCTNEENFRVDSDPTCKPCFEGLRVMTPNDDGRNDAFILNCVNTAANNHLEIYNRWGQLIFEADDYQCVSGGESDCWRGRTRGDRPVDEGGYFWVLEFDDTDGIRQRIRDHVTILNDN